MYPCLKCSGHYALIVASSAYTSTMFHDLPLDGRSIVLSPGLTRNGVWVLVPRVDRRMTGFKRLNWCFLPSYHLFSFHRLPTAPQYLLFSL